MKITDLSLREKALQTACIRHKTGKPLTESVGAVFFGGEIITEAEDIALEAARKTLAQYMDSCKIPPLITSDFENGCGSMVSCLTPLPYMSSLGAANDEQLAYDYGKATALEGRSIGANWSFSPVCDLLTNPRNPLVNVRSMTDDPELACRLLKQVIRGMQDGGLAACAKHFPGDGVDYRDQHIVTTDNSLTTEGWRKLHGKVFQELIDDGVMSIMPGHITLSNYQKERHENGLPLPATLSKELIQDLLKGEMGFQGVVVTDALDMGGFLGWYDSKERCEIESFKAGCDMMLWPTEHYVDNLMTAVESGYIPMERLNDAVERILRMKEKLGLFGKDNHAIELTDEEHAFVADVQKRTAEQSITLIKDINGQFPLSPEKTKKVTVVPVTHYEPALKEAELLCRELEMRGFAVTYKPEGVTDTDVQDCDKLIYALFSRSFRPIGFLDFHSNEARKLRMYLKYGVGKTVAVSFGSPHFGSQYFERVNTYVNAYSMLAPSVKAFVQAATGEIPFSDFSPFQLYGSCI